MAPRIIEVRGGCHVALVVVDPNLTSTSIGLRGPYGSCSETREQQGLAHVNEHLRWGHSGPNPTHLPHRNVVCHLTAQQADAVFEEWAKDGYAPTSYLPASTTFNAYTSNYHECYHVTYANQEDIDDDKKAFDAHVAGLFTMQNRKYMQDRVRPESHSAKEMFVVHRERELGEVQGTQPRSQMILASQCALDRYGCRSHSTIGPAALSANLDKDLCRRLKDMIDRRHCGLDWYVATPRWNENYHATLQRALEQTPAPTTPDFLRLNGNGPLIMKPPLQDDWDHRTGTMQKINARPQYTTTLAALSFPVGALGTPSCKSMQALSQAINSGGLLNPLVKSKVIYSAGFNVESFPTANYAALMCQPGPNFNADTMPRIVHFMHDRLQQEPDILRRASEELRQQDLMELHTNSSFTAMSRAMNVHNSGDNYTDVFALPDFSHMTSALSLALSDGAISMTTPGKVAPFAAVNTPVAPLKLPTTSFTCQEPLLRNAPATLNAPFPHAEVSADHNARVLLAFAVPFDAERAAVDQMLLLSMGRYLTEDTNLKSQGITFNLERRPTHMELSLQRVKSANSSSLADAVAVFVRAANDGAAFSQRAFHTNLQQLKGTCEHNQTVADYVSPQRCAAALWKPSSALMTPASEMVERQCAHVTESVMQSYSQQLTTSPTYVGGINLTNAEVRGIASQVRLAEKPLQRATAPAANTLPAEGVNIELDRDKTAMKRYCLMAPLSHTLNHQEIHTIRAASYVLGNGFYGQLMQKQRVDDCSCYSISCRLHGSMASQHAFVVDTSFSPDKAHTARLSTRQQVRNWMAGNFTQGDLDKAIEGYQGHAHMMVTDRIASQLLVQHMYGTSIEAQFQSISKLSGLKVNIARDLLSRAFSSSFVDALVS